MSKEEVPVLAKQICATFTGQKPDVVIAALCLSLSSVITMRQATYSKVLTLLNTFLDIQENLPNEQSAAKAGPPPQGPSRGGT